MSQYTYHGIDVYPQDEIPESALELPEEVSWPIRKLREFVGRYPKIVDYIKRHPELKDRVKFLQVAGIVVGMVFFVIYSMYILFQAVAKSFELQSELGFQAMTITLLTLFTLVFIDAFLSTWSAAHKLMKYKEMDDSELEIRVNKLEHRGWYFIGWSIIVLLILTAVPTFLSNSNNVPQTNEAKIVFELFIVALIVIEKIVEKRLTTKID